MVMHVGTRQKPELFHFVQCVASIVVPSMTVKQTDMNLRRKTDTNIVQQALRDLQDCKLKIRAGNEENVLYVVN